MINGHGEENWARKWGMEIALDGRLDKQGEWNGRMDGWAGGQTKSMAGQLGAGWLLALWEYSFSGRELGGARQAFTDRGCQRAPQGLGRDT